MIADTSFIIDLADKDPNAIKKAKELESRNEVVAITVLTLYEMWRGSANIGVDESKILSELAYRCPVIPLEPEAAREGGIINYRLKKLGSQIGSRDCLIAGIVMAGNDTLITRNVKHFSRIDEIKLETY